MTFCVFSSKVKFCSKRSFCSSIDASSDGPLKGLGGDMSIVLAAQSWISGARTEGLRAWRFWESGGIFISYRVLGARWRAHPACLPASTSSQRVPGAQAAMQSPESHHPGQGAPSKQLCFLREQLGSTSSTAILPCSFHR